MYDEIVRRLINCATQAAPCKTCDMTEDGACSDTLMKQAADAIEELSKLADAIPHKCECCVGCELEKKNGGCDNAFIVSPQRAKEYLSKPRWIPVTERCPDEWHCLLKKWQYDDRRITHWMPLPEPPKEET